MLINSLAFWAFLAGFTVPYFACGKLGVRWQNAWLLLGSAAFYAIADWRLLGLLIAVTIAFYFAGKVVETGESRLKSMTTTTAVALAIGLLFVFKYLNFALDGVTSLLQSLGFRADVPTVSLIVPLGISYYTFKLISYIVDVYKSRVKACDSLIDFGAYVMFFPTIMSGPIDRYIDFAPQLVNPRHLDAAAIAEGSKRVLWGFMLKMCIADRISPYTDAVFNNIANHSGITTCVASMLFLIQMYADFAGYSSMAIGVARMLGLNSAENFERPFFALNAGDFWRRWHISLSRWLRDYVYIPLGGSRCSRRRSFFNVMVTFLLCGAWHGANWTFIIFGAHHGLLVILARVNKSLWEKVESWFPSRAVYVGVRRLWLFLLCSLGALYFRANSVGDIITAFKRIEGGIGSLFTQGTTAMFSVGFIAIALMLFKEWNDENNTGRHFLHSPRRWVAVTSFATLLVFILLTGQLTGGSFIYVQF